MKFYCGLFVVMAGLLMPCTAAENIDISFTFSPTLHGGRDELGLVGSVITLTGTITNGTVYVDNGEGWPFAAFSSASCVITGASVSTNNGVFSLTNTLAIGAFPSIEGGSLLFGGVDGRTGSLAALGAAFSLDDMAIVGNVAPSFSSGIGALVDPADFGGIQSFSGSIFTGMSGSPVALYDIPGGVTNTVEFYDTVGAAVGITNPVSGTTFPGETTLISVSGTSSEWGVGTMAWTNDATGASGTFAASSSWVIVSVSLEFGANTISVTGTNVSGVASTDSITITRSHEPGPLTLLHYVATNGAAVWPYTSWATAATNINMAIVVASPDDMIYVSNGVYDTGWVDVNGMSNRVALTKAVTLQSANGPDVTFIVGAADPVRTNGPAAVRCAYVTTNAVLAGFTLTNGHTQASVDPRNSSGGGVLLDGGGAVNDCTITGNAASAYGGGVMCWLGGTLNDCTITGNSSAYAGGGLFCQEGGTVNSCTISDNDGVEGGGARMAGGTLNHCIVSSNVSSNSGGVFLSEGGTLNNCLVSRNSAAYAGGVLLYNNDSTNNCTLNNCTVSGNSANDFGGGITFDEGDGIVINCIVWENVVSNSVINWYEVSGVGIFTNVCTLPLPTNGVNCVTNAPQFADSGAGDYRLLSGSPCIDAGTALAWITDDIQGTPRPLNGDGSGGALPDIGAYEHSSPHHSTDGDAHSDHEEYIADTDATDSDHWLRITGLSAGGPSTILFDPASESRQYTLHYSTNLVEGVWNSVAGQVDIPGSGGTNSFVHTNSLSPIFYRVHVELIDEM